MVIVWLLQTEAVLFCSAFPDRLLAIEPEPLIMGLACLVRTFRSVLSQPIVFKHQPGCSWLIQHKKPFDGKLFLLNPTFQCR